MATDLELVVVVRVKRTPASASAMEELREELARLVTRFDGIVAAVEERRPGRPQEAQEPRR